VLYELRTYSIQPNRLADIRDRMLSRVRPLFDRHGMRAVAHWHPTAGTRLPGFVYMLEWDDAAHREAGWADFYADADWWRLRADTNAGQELVLSYGLWLLTPNPAWRAPLDVADFGTDTVHDMVVSRVEIGANEAVGAAVRETLIPHFSSEGRRFRGAFNVNSGARVPALVWFVSFSDSGARDHGWSLFDEGVAPAPEGVGVLGDRDTCSMRPLTVGTPD
jgi:NIPSNAP